MPSEKKALRPEVIAVLIAALGGGGWWWMSHRSTEPGWQGYAEADFVKVGPTLPGLLLEVLVKRGQHVQANAPLFDQDDISDRAARDQSAKQLASALELLANLEAPARDTEVRQGEANIAEARATRDRALADLRRAASLAQTGVISSQTWDQNRATYTSADSKVRGLEAMLTQLNSPIGRPNEIRSQVANVEAARAALAMAEWRLSQRHVGAPVSGVVADVQAVRGEVVNAGSVVVSLLPAENIFVRFFVPERDLSAVRRGGHVQVRCDNCSADQEGTISFISPMAEYTPPFIYSEENRARLVYLAEARLDAEVAARLNPGQPVTIRLVADAGVTASASRSPP